ncbi:MAG: ATP-binding cassette domain-containing protein [Oscillospiraceae bacterium]
MLKIKNLSKTFSKNTENEKKVLKNIDLTLDDGDFVTVIGSNGAGKSTLLNCITGNLELDGGEIYLDDEKISSAPIYKRASYISRVFQDPLMGTSSNMTIEENLSMALKRGGRAWLKSGKRNRAAICESLKQLNLGLEERLNNKVSLLSGGQRQAVSLLMATIKTPKLILLDEHTSALDPAAAEKILSITEKVVAEKKITTIMITHNMADAIKYGNRLIMMDEGEIIFQAKGEEKKKLTQSLLLEKFKSACQSDRMLLTM